MKEYRKELLKMHENRPKLFALIQQYLSEESKMAARSTYQTMRQGPFESIITYKERFTVAQKAPRLLRCLKT